MTDGSDPLLDAWKTFLKGRIAEEEGDREGALEAYEEALKVDPSNKAFQRSRANVRSALGSPDDAVAARVARQYEHLAAQLTGPDDDSDAWIESLQRLLQTADRGESLGISGQAHMVAW